MVRARPSAHSKPFDGLEGHVDLMVLGADERRCRDLGRETRGALRLLRRHDRVTVVCDVAQTALQPLHGHLGLLADGQVVAEGFVPSAREIAGMLRCRY